MVLPIQGETTEKRLCVEKRLKKLENLRVLDTDMNKEALAQWNKAADIYEEWGVPIKCTFVRSIICSPNTNGEASWQGSSSDGELTAKYSNASN